MNDQKGAVGKGEGDKGTGNVHPSQPASADLRDLELQAWAYAAYGDDGLETLQEIEDAEIDE